MIKCVEWRVECSDVGWMVSKQSSEAHQFVLPWAQREDLYERSVRRAVV